MTIERETLWTRRGLIAGGTSAGALALGGCEQPFDYGLIYEMTTVIEVDGKQMSASSVVQEGLYDGCPSRSGVKTFCNWGRTYKGIAPYFNLVERGYLVVPIGVGIENIFDKTHQQMQKFPPDLSRAVPIPAKALLHITLEALSDVKLVKLHYVAANTEIMTGVIYRYTEIAGTKGPLVRQYRNKPEWLELMRTKPTDKTYKTEKSTLTSLGDAKNSRSFRLEQFEG